jgi:predicted RNA methylase
LGAGAGLSGIVAAKYAKNVIISDGSDIVFKLIEKNVKIHQCEGRNVIAR